MRGALLALLLLAACGARTPSPTALRDELLQRQLATARLALDAGRAEESARLYGQALARARERDAAEDIAEAATGRTAALLARGDARGARAQADEALAELARRDAAPPATLLLASAAARLRAGDGPGAEDAARRVVAAGPADAAARAWFLLGLLAAERRDAAALEAARMGLGTPAGAAFRADAAELAGEAAWLSGDAAGARRLAAEAAGLRRDVLDYRGVTRALRLSARATPGAEAGDVLLRAARGAAARRELAEARALYAEAARAAPALAALARRESAALPE